MLMAMLIKQLQKISEVPFEAEYIVMDPGYNPQNRAKIEENAKILEIPIKIFETDIFGVVDKIEKNPCYLCARMRRGHLYSMAKKLGCNKIALGHHLNDVIDTTVMGMFYGAQIQGMMPKLHSTNFEGMELIRPLYRINEKDIISWCKYNSLEFIRCACRFTENDESSHENISKRKEITDLIAELKKINPNIPDTDRIRQGGEAPRILDASSPTEIPPPLNTAKIVSTASRSAARKQRTLLRNDEVVDGSVVFNGSFPPYLI